MTQVQYHLDALVEQIAIMAAANEDRKRADDFTAAHFAANGHLRALHLMVGHGAEIESVTP